MLYLTEDIDEFVVQTLEKVEDKPFKAVSDPDALPETEAEKEAHQKQTEEYKDVLDFAKETLGDRVSQVRISQILKSAPVCMVAGGPMSFEMERYFEKVDGSAPMKAERILEFNAQAEVFAALKEAVERDKDKAHDYVELLYAQALLAAGLPLEDVAGYTQRVCRLMK